MKWDHSDGGLIMQVFKGQTEDFKFYSKYNEKPSEGFEQGSDMIRFLYFKR